MPTAGCWASSVAGSARSAPCSRSGAPTRGGRSGSSSCACGSCTASLSTAGTRLRKQPEPPARRQRPTERPAPSGPFSCAPGKNSPRAGDATWSGSRRSSGLDPCRWSAKETNEVSRSRLGWPIRSVLAGAAGTATMTLAYAAERRLRRTARGPLDYDDSLVPARDGSVGDHGLEVGAPPGDLDEDVGAGREAERADSLGIDLVARLEERERPGDVLVPPP